MTISVDGRDHRLEADDLTVHRRASGALVVQADGARFAALDTTVTPELRAEGLAREIVSRVQRLRKESGLAVSDRISLSVAGGTEVRAVVEQFRQWIAGEVLAREIVVVDEIPHDERGVSLELEDATAQIALTRDSRP